MPAPSPPARSRVRRGPLALLALAAALVAALLLSAAPASAAEPPNQNDPCSEGGRDTCGGTGVGSYERYRYGLRWFGDFRGVVPGATHPTFCIDLRFWYPDREHDFREFDNAGLRNKEGQGVSIAKQRRMAYALWNFGRSNQRAQQAAVMLYVHGLMGDGAPGEVAKDAIGPQVEGIYDRIARDAARYHGPYRLDARIPGGLTAGKPATGTVRLLSASGRPVPGVRITLSATGASGVPAVVRTNSSGVGTIRFTPTTGTGVTIEARSEEIASTLPRLFRPTTGGAQVNGQRLASAESQRVSATATQVSSKATISVTTTAFPAKLLVGQANRDKVTISGLPSGRRTTVTSLLFGPFRTRESIRCDGTPVARNTVERTRSGTFGTPVVRPTQPGYYTYQLVIAGDQAFDPVTTPCGIPAETFVVERQPTVTTKVSSQSVTPGTAVTDTVIVSGLADEDAVVRAALYGPFPSRAAIRCDTPPVWAGNLPVTGDGEYLTPPVTLTTPGYYTYKEWLDAVPFVRAAETQCAEVAETTVVTGTPQVTTQVSDQTTAPGSVITDSVVVTGLGALEASVNVSLWGPFPSREAIVCTGTPYWTGAITVTGDGTYTTPQVTLDRAGYYTYTESIAGTEAHGPTATACGDAAETTLATAAPQVTTVVSKEVVRPGAAVYDTLRVTGLGKTSVEVEAELFGPFPTRAAIRCTGTPVWRGTVTANGDGTYRTATTKLPKVGLYTYRERIVGSETVTGTRTECALVEETSLAMPAVNTGRGDEGSGARLLQAGTARPTRLRFTRLGIDAPVAPVGIDLRKGELDVPDDVRRTGWWRDGAAPGDARGSVLIAGHVDSRRQGEGAFFRFDDARVGDRVEVRTADGRTRTYRVTQTRHLPKGRLPASIWSLKGRHRLTLVTCGGPFDQAAGRYVDNLMITAVPV
ncbi:MAG: sortase [Thermoleophilia bacterium]